MFNDILNDIWNNYRGRLLCSVFGLFIGVVVLWLGFFQALFLMICIGLGFFIGNKLDKKEDLLEWLDRLLPPGYHRITAGGGRKIRIICFTRAPRSTELYAVVALDSHLIPSISPQINRWRRKIRHHLPNLNPSSYKIFIKIFYTRRVCK